jgi:hypothetical protein
LCPKQYTTPQSVLLLPPVRRAKSEDYRFIDDIPRANLERIPNDAGKILVALLLQPACTIGTLMALTRMTGTRLNRAFSVLAQDYGDHIQVIKPEGLSITLREAVSEEGGENFYFVILNRPKNSPEFQQLLDEYKIKPQLIEPAREAMAVHLKRVIRNGFGALRNIAGAIPYVDNDYLRELAVSFEPLRINDCASLRLRIQVPKTESVEKVKAIVRVALAQGFNHSKMRLPPLAAQKDVTQIALYPEKIGDAVSLSLEFGGCGPEEIQRTLYVCLGGMLHERALKLFKK